MRNRIGFCLAAAILCIIGITQSIPAHAAGTSLPIGFTRVLHTGGLVEPTAFAFQGKKIFVAQKEGALRFVNAKGVLRDKAYVSLHVTSDKERRLLGVAIDPNYKETQ